MKPFLLLASRAEDDAADDEYGAFLRFADLSPDQLHRIRMEAGPTPPPDLDRYSGILVGGSPFNSSDDPSTKSDVQRRVEAELAALLDDVVARDFPVLGACYGIGTLGLHQGGVVDQTYAEVVGAVPITLTAAGRDDPLLAGLSPQFNAFVGHKEACSVLPPGATLLGSSPSCPVQIFRVGRNMYATQFHPELDLPGLLTRLAVYDRHGYYPPGEAETVLAEVRRSRVTEPPQILRNFVIRYARD